MELSLTLSHPHPRPGKFVFGALPLIFIILIDYIYHLLTFKFKTLEITKEGINNKMSLLDKGYISFSEVKKIEFGVGKIIIKKHNGITKSWMGLKLDPYIKNKIERYLWNYKHKSS